jgi:putative endonuclease
MSYVYIIQDKITKKYYIGSCLELSKRFRRHNQHTATKTTSKGIWRLIVFKKCKNISEARSIEKKLKSYKGGNAFKKIINGELAEWSKAPHC